MTFFEQTHSMMKQKKLPRWWFYFVIPVGSTILTIMFIELVFVIFHPIPFSIEKNMYFEADPFTGYKLKPNSMGYFQQLIPAQANKNGHRDELVLIKKTDGTLRILVLGDSFTVGANVAQDDIYVEVLETLLTKNNKSPVEVINTGVGGWQPFQYAQYYEHYGWKFSPDIILVGFFVGNDTYDKMTNVQQLRTAILGRRISRKAALERFISLKVFMYNHSNIARLILNKRAITRSRRLIRKHCADFSDSYLNIQHNRMPNHLKRTNTQEKLAQNSIEQIKRIKKLAERDSIPLVIVLIPDENQININLQQALLTNKKRKKFDFEMPQSMLKDMFADIAIPVIDLLPSFLEDSRCLYMNDTHWTAKGHALAAEVIHEKLIGEKMLPELTQNNWHK